jgi:hypothetical protein
MKLQRLSSPVFFRSALLVLAGVLAAQAASAMSLRELRALAQTSEQGENLVQYYLVGVMEGALEAHAQAVRHGAQAIICLNGRRLEPSMAQSLYQTELKRYAELYEADMPVALVLTHALATVYAC